MPLDGLVRVGKELRRNCGAAGEILGSRDGRDQRADIRDEAKLALVKKRLELDEVRVETEITAVPILEREGEKRRLDRKSVV